jgi:hypothetical protein
VRYAHYKNCNKKADALFFLQKNIKSILLQLRKKKLPNWKEHKKVVPSMKSVSSPKKPAWFAYKALILLLQHKKSQEVAVPSLKKKR